jgi:hypothetical protein
MAARRVDHENPFRVNSPRNVLLRARERFQLVSEWLKMRREDSRRTAAERERDSESRH